MGVNLSSFRYGKAVESLHSCEKERSCGCLKRWSGELWWENRRVWAEKIARALRWQKLQVIWISIRYNQPRCTQDFTSPRASTNSSSHTTRGWNGQKLHPGSKIQMEWWAWSEVDWVPRLHMQRQLGGFLKWWYPTTIGFPTKNDQHLGCEMGGKPTI